MALLDEILGAQGGDLPRQLARQFNLDESQVQGALGQLVPSISRGIQQNSASSGGLEALANALGSGRHRQYVDDPSTLGRPETTEDGNNILGHIFGSKQTSRDVAAQAADKTGVDSAILKQMLPMIAAAAMGALSKKTAESGGSESGLGGLLGSFLDADKDGSIADDLFDMAKKFF